MKYVYCIAADPPSLEGWPRGFGGRVVEGVAVGRVAALVSDVGGGEVVADFQSAAIHGEVVQAALERSSSVLPCRFGTVLPDGEALRALLHGEYDRLVAGLERLRGRLEVGVRVMIPGAPEVAAQCSEAGEPGDGAGEGAGYLRARQRWYAGVRAMRERARTVRRELDEATTSLWAEARAEERHTAEGLLLSLVYLVEREKLPAFEGAIREYQVRRPALRLLSTGPWPPYSFADVEVAVSPARGTSPNAGAVRKLIYIPIVHTAVDLGSQEETVKEAHIARFGRASWLAHVRAVEELWTRLRERVLALPLDYGAVRLYQDGLPACGKELEIVERLAGIGSRNHQLLLELVRKGATLMGTEDAALLLEERERLLRAGMVRSAPERWGISLYDELLERRDAYIARTIAATLQAGEAGLLLAGALHRVVERLPPDIQVERLVYEPAGEESR